MAVDAIAVLGGIPPVDAVPVEAIAELLGKLRRVEVELWRRLLAEHAGQRAPAADEPLLTVAEAAKLLAFPESYVRELTRKGDLLCVRNGKYVRVHPADVRAWVARHRDGVLASQRYVTYHSRCDGERGTAASATAGTHADAARRTRGRRPQQRRAMGARRDGDARVSGASAPAPRLAAAEVQTNEVN